MATVAYSRIHGVGLNVGNYRCSALIGWTECILAITLSWWQHHKHCHEYSITIINYINLSTINEGNDVVTHTSASQVCYLTRLHSRLQKTHTNSKINHWTTLVFISTSLLFFHTW